MALAPKRNAMVHSAMVHNAMVRNVIVHNVWCKPLWVVFFHKALWSGGSFPTAAAAGARPRMRVYHASYTRRCQLLTFSRHNGHHDHGVSNLEISTLRKKSGSLDI